jgi:hypothetical protein
MEHNLKDSYKTSGFVKPGASIDTLIASATGDIEYLRNRQSCFLGGTNDVSKNNSQGGLKHIVNFVETNSHMNIILVSVPHRYDLSGWSCVNSEVKTFSRKLVKLMKSFKHVTVVKEFFY